MLPLFIAYENYNVLKLLDNCSNTSRSYSTSTFTLRWIHNPITFRCISDTFLSVLFQIFPHI